MLHKKRGIGNRRLLEKIKAFFTKIVIIIKFMKKIVHIQKVIVTHEFDIMGTHTFRMIFSNPRYFTEKMGTADCMLNI